MNVLHCFCLLYFYHISGEQSFEGSLNDLYPTFTACTPDRVWTPHVLLAVAANKLNPTIVVFKIRDNT